MKSKLLALVLAGILVSIVFSGYQCGSAEMTSAKLYLQRSEWDNAKDQLEKELVKNPQNFEAWFLLGRVNYENKNYEGMLDAFNNSLKHSNQYKKDIDNFRLSIWASSLNKGVENYNQAIQAENPAENYNVAISNLKTSILMMPDSAAGYRILGLCYYGKKELDNSIPYFKESLKRQNDPQIGRILGAIYYDKAIEAKEQAQSLEGTEKENLLKKMNTNLDEAINILETASKDAPEDVNLLALLNDSYIAAGKTEDAMKLYQSAIKADPQNKYVYYNYGVLLLRANKFEEATINFEKSLGFDSKFTDALYNTGAAYMQWGQKMKEKAEAVAAGDKSKIIDKSYEEKFKKSKQNLEKLIEVDPNDLSGWETLGMVNTILNLPKEAKIAFDKADELRKKK